MIQLLKHHLFKAQQRMTVQAYKHHSNRSFQNGDMVYLKFQPYRQSFVVARKFSKLVAKYLGPYKIIDKIGNATYKLDLPSLAVIHPVFHVSQLKIAISIGLSMGRIWIRIQPGSANFFEFRYR